MFRSKTLGAVEQLLDAVEQLKAVSTDADSRISDAVQKLAARTDALYAGFGRLDSDVVRLAESLTAAHARLGGDFNKSMERIEAALRLVAAVSPEITISNAIAGIVAAADDRPPAPPVETALPHPFSNLSRDAWSRSVKRWRAHAGGLLARCDPRPCPACASARSEFLFRSYDDYPFHECLNCGAWYAPLRVNRALFDRYFEVCPEGRENSDYMLTQDEVAVVREADLSRFTEYYSELRDLCGSAGGALLDIGCGVGTSLDAAGALGFEAAGVEISDAAREAAGKRGRRVYATLDQVPPVKFDIISLFESLEHMERTDEVGAFAAARLAPSGLLVITVPNLNSPALRSMRGDSLHINGGSGFAGHINLFTQDTLTRFLSRHGFEVVRARGQFSMNLLELAAYHLGAWRGARDYLDSSTTSVTLPARAHALLNAIGPAVTDWERRFAMGPILRVIARRA